MTQPLVSVIISSYNHAAYIEACIRSVLEQTYKPVELLVYDDGSRDDSVAIIQALADRHGFFFQAQANQGLAATLNAGIKRARGNFIAPFGSDDIMLAERFERQMPWLLAHPEVGIAAGNIIKIDEHGARHPAKRQRHYPPRSLDFNDMFRGLKEGPPTATLLFRREALEAIGGFNPAIRLEDLFVELKITEAGWQIGVMEEDLAYYRVHPTNTVKDLRMMHEAVLKTYAEFACHEGYVEVCNAWINHQFLRAANRDKAFARACLRELPWRAWNLRTLRGVLRLLIG